MSITLWFILILTVIVAIVIFKKTVANDARNEFKLRDVLSQDDDEEDTSLDNEANITYSTYMQKEEYRPDYRTEIHESVEEEKIEQQPETSKDFEEEKVEHKFDKDIDTDIRPDKTIYKKRPNPFVLVKTFWRGITFTFGLLLVLYSLFGIVTQTRNAMDVIIYSIWLLIGVILIK